MVAVWPDWGSALRDMFSRKSRIGHKSGRKMLPQEKNLSVMDQVTAWGLFGGFFLRVAPFSVSLVFLLPWPSLPRS